MRNVLLGLTVVLSGVLCAEEIEFIGADTANPTNLSSTANWSAPPTADVVGVIDLSKTSAAGYVVEGVGLALKGLRIEGAAGKTITLGGASVLTLGESGGACGASGEASALSGFGGRRISKICCR